MMGENLPSRKAKTAGTRGFQQLQSHAGVLFGRDFIQLLASILESESLSPMTLKILLRSLIVLAMALSALPSVAHRGEGELNPDLPAGLTVEQIIQKVSAKELEFAKARENYTWHQSVKVQEMDGDTAT